MDYIFVIKIFTLLSKIFLIETRFINSLFIDIKQYGYQLITMQINQFADLSKRDGMGPEFPLSDYNYYITFISFFKSF